AREMARRSRRLLLDGIDPIEHRKLERAKRTLEMSAAKTFDQCAADYIAAKRAEWTNSKHADQWTNTLRKYVTPVFGTMPVQAITSEHVVSALKPIWESKTETATRVRQRVEAVFDFAKASTLRSGDNPAQWSGVLEFRLADPSIIKTVEHLPA